MSDKHSEVFIVVGDTGAALDLVPVAEELKKLNITHTWIADPNGKARVDVLEKHAIPYETWLPGEYGGEMPHYLICGTSSTHAGRQVAWTNFCKKRKIHVDWFEDLWGTGEQKSQSGASPDRMLVVDRLAQEVVLNVRPSIRTSIVGKPSFGKIPAIEEISAIRKEVRAKLGLSEKDFLVSWGFQGEPHRMATAHVGEIIRTKLQLDAGMVVAWRLHPKHAKKEEHWETLTKSGINFIPAAREVDLMHLYLSSNAVVVPFGGTDGYKAVLRGIPTITPIFPSGAEGKKLYDGYDDEEARKASGFLDGIPALLMKDRLWGARSPQEVLKLLRFIRENEQEARKTTFEKRAELFRGLENPEAAKTIARLVMEKISSF